MKNLTYKKLFVLAFMLLFCISGHSQTANTTGLNLNLSFSITGVGGAANNCLPHGQTRTFQINHDSPHFEKFIFSAAGDIEIVEYTETTAVVRAISGYFGAGWLYATGHFCLPEYLMCVANNCWHRCGTITRGVDIFQEFTAEQLGVEARQIAGSITLRSGGIYPYSVQPILTRNLRAGIGLDKYRWGLPQSGVVQEEYSSEDGSSITIRLPQGQRIGNTDTLKVWFGRCNFYNAPHAVKVLRPASELPDVRHDSLECVTSDTIRFWVENRLAGHTYWFTSTQQDFTIMPLGPGRNAKRDSVDILTNGRGGRVILHASNGFDTITKEFEITRRTNLNSIIIGDTGCLQQDVNMMFALYPSPNVEILWHLPNGWEQDDMNEHSSTVFLAFGEEAISGWIKATSLACNELFDSIFVTVGHNNYVPEGIVSDNGICFQKGDTATFRFNRDPNAKYYTWEFPTGWTPIGANPTLDNNDTVMKVIVGGTMGNISVASTAFCGDGWTMTFYDAIAKPSITSIYVTSRGDCINDGIDDAITLTAEGSNGVTQYQWLFPDTWNVLKATDNTIELAGIITDNTEVFVIGLSEQCGSTDTISTIITLTGADIEDFIVTYFRHDISAEWDEPGMMIEHRFTIEPDLILSPTQFAITWFRNEDDLQRPSTTYSEVDGEWFYPVVSVDTSLNEYSILITNLATGCSTRRWLRNPYDGEVELREYTVHTTPQTPADPPSAEPTSVAEYNEPMEIVVVPTVAPRPTAPQQAPPPPSVAEVQVVETPSVERLKLLKPTFQFHPNPANGNIYLQFQSPADWVEIVDMRGVVVVRQRVSGTPETVVNVSNLRVGTYIVRVLFGETAISQRLQVIR